MSLKIEVFVDHEQVGIGNAANYLDHALGAIGFRRGPQLAPPYTGEVAYASDPAPAAVQPPASETPAEEAPRRRGRKPKDEPAPNISASPENRVDPTAVGDDAETAAQDAADEQAEVDANRRDAAPLTIDDVKKAVSGYVHRYGLDVTQADGPKIFVEALGQPPAGEGYWKLSILPDDQEKLQRCIDVWNKATELNPLKRAKVA